jgi:hypothetical protein
LPNLDHDPSQPAFNEIGVSGDLLEVSPNANEGRRNCHSLLPVALLHNSAVTLFHETNRLPHIVTAVRLIHLASTALFPRPRGGPVMVCVKINFAHEIVRTARRRAARCGWIESTERESSSRECNPGPTSKSRSASRGDSLADTAAHGSDPTNNNTESVVIGHPSALWSPAYLNHGVPESVGGRDDHMSHRAAEVPRNDGTV